MNPKRTVQTLFAIVGLMASIQSSMAETFQGIFHPVTTGAALTQLTGLIDSNKNVYNFETASSSNVLTSSKLNSNKESTNTPGYTTINASTTRDLALANLYRRLVGGGTYYLVADAASPTGAKSSAPIAVTRSNIYYGYVVLSVEDTGNAKSTFLTYTLTFYAQPIPG